MIKKALQFLSFLLPILILLYFLGPKVDAPKISAELPFIKENLFEINNLIQKENVNKNIRKGNHSRIIWKDSVPTKTKYSVIYLHGFSASPAEK